MPSVFLRHKLNISGTPRSTQLSVQQMSHVLLVKSLTDTEELSKFNEAEKKWGSDRNKSASAHSQCSGAGTEHHTEPHTFIFTYPAQLLHAMGERR